MSQLYALAGSGAPSNTVTRRHKLNSGFLPRGAKLQRSNQKRGKQADEHGRKFVMHTPPQTDEAELICL